MSYRTLPAHTSTSIENIREWLVPTAADAAGSKPPIVWSAPGESVMIQRVEPGPLTADEADRLGDALHAAAAYVRKESSDA